MRTVSRYVAARVFVGLLTAAIVVGALIVLVDFVEQSRNSGYAESVGTFGLLGLTLLGTPQLIEETLPFIVLFGMMGSLYRLNRRSELIVMRAAGLSAWRFLWPAIAVAGITGVLWVAIFNPLSIRALDFRKALIAEHITPDTPKNAGTVWLREGDFSGLYILRARGADLVEQRLFDTTIFQFERSSGDGLRFIRRFDAPQAQLSERQWILSDVYILQDETRQGPLDSFKLPTKLDARTLREQIEFGDPSPSAVWDMPARIRAQSNAGFATTRTRIGFWRLIALPILLIAMTIISAGVAMRLARQGGTLRLILAGAGIGFAVFFIGNFMRAFGQVGVLPAWLAVWATPLIVLSLGLATLSRLEDG